MTRLVLGTALALGLLCAPLWAGPAFAERRIALVIGNSAYQDAPALPNPTKDAHSMADMFKSAGFDVVNAQYDLGYLPFVRTIRQFADLAADADIAVVYYAGHGVQIGGENYLVPVDAKVDSSEAASMEAITLDELQAAVGKAKLLHLIILDACRDNPFVTKTARRGINPGGLAPVDVAPGNSLIAFAAKGGSEALDGNQGHSPYTIALMHNLFKPGRSVQIAFTYVRDEVLKATDNRQEPYVYGSLGADAITLVPGVDQPPVADDRDAKHEFDLIDTIVKKSTPDQAVNAWTVYLAEHPTGHYSDLARGKINDLHVAKAEPPPPPSPPRLSDAQRAWAKIETSSNPDDFKGFIKRFPDSPLALIAQDHLRMIEDRKKADADREAARKALGDAKKKADEAARQSAQQEAALQQAQKEAQKAEEARQQAAAEAAKKHQEEEQHKKALAAAQAQQKAEQQAALERAKEASKAAERAKKEAEAEAEAKREAEAHQAALAETARQKQEAACKTEQDRLTSLQAAGSGARSDLKQLEQGLTCERLRPLVTAALERANDLANTNTPDQVRLAQKELTRLGCYSGAADGTLSDATKAAVTRYQSQRREPAGKVEITDNFVAELTKQSATVCPLTCAPGQRAEGEHCIAAEKPAPVARQNEEHGKAAEQRHAKEEVQEKSAQRRKTGKEKARREEAKHEKKKSEPRPRVTQQAASVHGGGATIGVGF